MEPFEDLTDGEIETAVSELQPTEAAEESQGLLEIKQVDWEADQAA